MRPMLVSFGRRAVVDLAIPSVVACNRRREATVSAVAVLLESRFPRGCNVADDITESFVSTLTLFLSMAVPERAAVRSSHSFRLTMEF